VLLTPVTILTGFLGSGKTTLINALLSTTKERVAIIENEFGEVDIDSDLIKTADVVRLPNGCVCCSIRGEFARAMRELAARIEAGEFAADRFVIETTGLADPAPIVQTFFTDEVLRNQFALDGVVTLVDAAHIERHLDEYPVCAQQIGFAERLIITKSDIAPISGELIDRLRLINRKALIIEAANGELDERAWLGLGAYEMSADEVARDGYIKAGAPKLTRFSSEPIPSYPDTVRSFVLRGGAMDYERLDAFLEELIEAHGNDMLRYKGVLALQGEPRKLVLQGVHKVAGLDYAEEFTEPPSSVMVIIGRNLPQDEITAKFLACEA
jgi:G3E family GTPase